MAVGLFAGQGVTLVASAARTTSTNSGNLKDTTANLSACDAFSIVLDVTANAGDAPTLDVQLDTSPDGGTTWFKAYGFTQVTTSTATRRLDVRYGGLNVGEAAAENSIAGTGQLKVDTVLSRDLRVKWTVAGNPSGITFGVYALIQPLGLRQV